MSVTRRRVLAFGVAGAALLGVGSGLSWIALGYRVGPDDVPVALSAKEMAVVRAIVECLFPAEGAFPSGLDLGVHQRIDEEIWSSPAHVRSDLKAAIQLLEHVPPVYGYFGRLSSLPVEARLACFLDLLEAGLDPVARAAQALKQLSHLFYYAADASWAAIGYDGPWVKTPSPSATSNAYAEAVRTRRQG
ncbi:MAG: hypothetical protein H6737_24590 [Alphaproteobacteria bacterium]|nr:hypothetical protein [Alphaproteobacteria bacterium]